MTIMIKMETSYLILSIGMSLKKLMTNQLKKY